MSSILEADVNEGKIRRVFGSDFIFVGGVRAWDS